MNKPSGIDQARIVAEKIKAEVNGEIVEQKKEMENAIALVQANEELRQMYVDNAKLGAENLGGNSPLLKVHQTGKSPNELENGEEPNNGWFFYKPTKEQFKEVYCHILTISRGFRTESMDKDKKDLKFNQIIGGLIVNDGQLLPFVMYVNGKRLSNVWEFGREVAAYTSNKDLPLPMFSLLVKLTTHKEDNDYGYSFIVDFEIVKNEAGHPQIITDPGEFVFVKDSVSQVNEIINNIVSSKNNSEDAVEYLEDEPPHPADMPF